MDRLIVRNILKRKRYKLERNDYTCVLCSRGTEEITFHLFFNCPFSQECWRSLNILCDFSLDFFSMMDEAKKNYQHEFFMKIFLLDCWHIWKQRNAFIFNKVPLPGVMSFFEEASLQSYTMT
jgi:hypothetical protein